jgi:hypothetical protein
MVSLQPKDGLLAARNLFRFVWQRVLWRAYYTSLRPKLKTDLGPIGAGQNRAGQGQEDDEENESAAAARAGHATPETKLVL